MLYLNVKVGDKLDIGDGLVIIEVSKKQGQQIKIGVNAPKDLAVELISKTSQVRQNGLPEKLLKK